MERRLGKRSPPFFKKLRKFPANFRNDEMNNQLLAVFNIKKRYFCQGKCKGRSLSKAFFSLTFFEAMLTSKYNNPPVSPSVSSRTDFNKGGSEGIKEVFN